MASAGFGTSTHAQTSYATKNAPLFVPELTELATAMQTSLSQNFQKVTVEVVNCPDLTEIGCPAAGISGNTALVDSGGVPFLLNPQYQNIYFDLPEILNACDRPGSFAFGAAAAWNGRVDVNAELMPCYLDEQRNSSHFSLVTSEDGSTCDCLSYPWTEQGPLSNMFLSDGTSGPVIRVEAEVRTGSDNFVSCIRKGLIEQLNLEGEKQVGLGGVFLVEEGKIRSHIMSDFLPTCLMDGGPEVEDWLKFYEVGPNLLCLSTLITGDPTGGDLHLRLEHTHFFTRPGSEEEIVGGHYHYDTTPETIKYVGYFSPAEYIYRVRDAWEELPVEDLAKTNPKDVKQKR